MPLGVCVDGARGAVPLGLGTGSGPAPAVTGARGAVPLGLATGVGRAAAVPLGLATGVGRAAAVPLGLGTGVGRAAAVTGVSLSGSVSPESVVSGGSPSGGCSITPARWRRRDLRSSPKSGRVPVYGLGDCE